MSIQWIDVSREWLSAPLYPGDPQSKTVKISDMSHNDVCNTTALYACVHSGTHIDAPCHFFEEGGDIESLSLEDTCGECYVFETKGVLTGENVDKLPLFMCPPRILFKGDVQLTQSAASALCAADVKLIGVEGTSVACPTEEAEVHRLLLSNGVIILEGLDLSAIKPSKPYYLLAAPIRIAGADGAPVRALLAEK